MSIAAILGGKGRDVVTIAVGDSVGEAVALLAGRRIGAVPVMDGDTVAGIFSERDVIRCLADDGSVSLDVRVADRMSTPAITVTPDQSVLGALSLMTERRIRHLPVVDGGRVVGIVSIGDLVKYRIDKIENEAAAMRDYIQQV